MATPVMMPNVGITVESCILVTWHKKKGDAVKKGDILFTYETDKSTLDEESPVDGIMLEQFFNEDDDVKVMTNVCVIGNEGESTAEFAPAEAAAPAPAAEAAPAPAVEAAPAPAAQAAPVAAAAPVAQGEFVKISPRAKALAAKAGVDARFAGATGPDGRIIERDIRTLIENGPTSTPAAMGAFDGAAGTGIGGKFSVNDIGAATPAVAAQAADAPEFVDEKMPTIRKTIAKQMVNSLATAAQLTHTVSFDATEIMAFRKKVKNNAEAMGLNNITLNDIMLYAVSRVLKNEAHRDLNAHLVNGDTMRYFTNVNLGIAVDTPKGLLVPTLHGANLKSLNQISAEAKKLAKTCQDGAATPDMLQGASFTISNLGSFGIESFTPVINTPQVAILGVGTITTRVREVAGEIKTYPAMSLSLTYDHRAVDGAPASRFLVDLKNALENFSILLSK
ncbi:MAG: 2-oxo acid dehydrogenase subunit E2 [Clostridia bacterium]|nr:2-oxo acid dehydrogenase subunit E2 [Clostridia bacterium]